MMFVRSVLPPFPRRGRGREGEGPARRAAPGVLSLAAGQQQAGIQLGRQAGQPRGRGVRTRKARQSTGWMGVF